MKARKTLTWITAMSLFAGVQVRSLAQEQADTGAQTVIQPNPVPLINQPLVPDAVRPGGAGFTLRVNGTGFVPGAVVRWNGVSRATTFVSRSSLTASVLASDIAKPHTAFVTVLNPAPSGGKSNVVFLEVTTPSQSIGLRRSDLITSGAQFDLVVGDFNGDGKPDLAVANLESVSILLGNGDGTFKTAADYPGSETCSATGCLVMLGDFNRDGKLDLVVSNSFSGDVRVLLGNGDGTFQTGGHYGAGTGAFGLAVGDFNTDGKLDLAVANVGGNDISILLGNGDGTFQAAMNYGAGSQPAEVAVGDFNGDGKLDLAVANFGGNDVSILSGNGDGTFQAAVNYGTGSKPASVMVGDFKGDHKLDLVVANFGSNNVGVLLGNGDGTFKAVVNYGAGSRPDEVAVADLNGDGKLDLAVGDDADPGLSVLMGNGDGTFKAAVTFSVGFPVPFAAVGDFNGDGRLDLAGVNTGGSGVFVLLQTPTISLSKTSLTFTDQLVGTTSAAGTVTLGNTSGLLLKIGSVAVTGTNATDFGQANTCGTGLAPGAKCNIAVSFTPTKIGPRTASVTITDNAAGSPQAVALSGTGVTSGPNATLSAASLTFNTQLVGTTSPAKSLKLSNYGTSVLSIASIVASGDFSEMNNCGSSLAAGASCTIGVTFKPTQIGPRTGTLLITDNAPGSSQVVNLKGAGTIVKLVPASLDFGNVSIFGGKSTKTTSLTNTGKTTLTITSITITGSSYFSQTNNCGTSVAAAKSCTITVTFAPKQRGSFRAAVSVSDNGGGSPQLVPLSGTGISTDSAEVRSALTAYSTASVPSPQGPNNVGTRVMRMVDSTRDDPYLANGSKRELMVRFWFPASLNQGCQLAEYTSLRTWSYFSQLLGMPLPEVTTNSCLNAPIVDGAHPVIVFTHGYTGTFTDYTFIFEDLASRGYVVASVDHTYEATAVEFPDGRLVKSVLGSHLGGHLRGDNQALSLALSVRLGDLKFVVNELERLNTRADSAFAGKLDMSRIALSGHSLGGLAALLGLDQEVRFRAGVILDGIVEDGSLRATDKPVLVLAAGREVWGENECRLWDQLRGPRMAVNLKGAEHVTPSDAVWLAKGALKTGAMGSEKTIAAIRDYIAAFLAANLRGKSWGPLLSGPSSDYPDAAVTTRKQSLCGRP